MTVSHIHLLVYLVTILWLNLDFQKLFGLRGWMNAHKEQFLDARNGKFQELHHHLFTGTRRNHCNHRSEKCLKFGQSHDECNKHNLGLILLEMLPVFLAAHTQGEHDNFGGSESSFIGDIWWFRYQVCDQVGERCVVLFVPESMYDFTDQYVRLGFGRANLKEALVVLGEFLGEHIWGLNWNSLQPGCVEGYIASLCCHDGKMKLACVRPAWL